MSKQPPQHPHPKFKRTGTFGTWARVAGPCCDPAADVWYRVGFAIQGTFMRAFADGAQILAADGGSVALVLGVGVPGGTLPGVQDVSTLTVTSAAAPSLRGVASDHTTVVARVTVKELVPEKRKAVFDTVCTVAGKVVVDYTKAASWLLPVGLAGAMVLPTTLPPLSSRLTVTPGMPGSLASWMPPM